MQPSGVGKKEEEGGVGLFYVVVSLELWGNLEAPVQLSAERTQLKASSSLKFAV